MSDSGSFIEIDGQHAELLPARAVLSMIVKAHGGCQAGNGGDAYGGIGINLLNIDGLLGGGGDQTNSAANAYGGAGGSCN